MNRNLIFVFTLLATLFMVNAVPHQLLERNNGGTITFNACPLTDIPTVTVTIAPNPIVAQKSVAFSVFGTLNSNITAGTTVLAVEFADSTGQKLLTDAYFQVFTEPFKAGTTVSITAPSIHAPCLPDEYTIGVAIGDPVVGNPIAPLNIYGCSYAVVGGSTLSFSDSAYPFTGIAN